jgi:hypothetical protein
MKTLLAILILSMASCAMPDAVRGPDSYGVSRMVLHGKLYVRRAPGWWSDGDLSRPVSSLKAKRLERAYQRHQRAVEAAIREVLNARTGPGPVKIPPILLKK